jgi:4-hydroxybenzoate polyprenyltransferase
MPAAAFALIRPKHWLKTVFVLAPVIFSRPGNPLEAGSRVAAAFAVFCLLSSAVYCVNDVLDRHADRKHPRKRDRPVAAGHISAPAAFMLAAALAVAAMSLAALTLPSGVAVVAALYLANNAAYTTVLKHHAIVDVLSIAVGFVLRLMAGALAIPAAPSKWLLVCGFALSLLLALGKRRAELGSVGADSSVRNSLQVYTEQKLDVLLSTTASLTLLSYMLYTVAAETEALHATSSLVYTTPVVAYGVFRFIFKAHEARGDGPVEILSADPVFAGTGLVWMALVAGLLWRQ